MELSLVSYPPQLVNNLIQTDGHSSELHLTQVIYTGESVTEAPVTLEMMYQELYQALLTLSTSVAERALMQM